MGQAAVGLRHLSQSAPLLPVIGPQAMPVAVETRNHLAASRQWPRMPHVSRVWVQREAGLVAHPCDHSTQEAETILSHTANF